MCRHLLRLLLCCLIAVSSVLPQRGSAQPEILPDRVTELIEQTRAPDPARRLSAAERLGYSRDGRAAAPLIKLLDDIDPRVRAQAATSLGRIGDRDGVNALVKLLDDPEPAARLAALEGMQQAAVYCNEDTITTVLAMLADPAPAMRAAAAKTIERAISMMTIPGQPKPWLAKPALPDALHAALGDADPACRMAVMRAVRALLGQQQARVDRLLPAVRNVLNDPDLNIRALAALAMCRRKVDVEIESLVACLRAPDAGLRRELIGQLGIRPDRAAIEAVLAMLDDPEPAVRQQAAGSLQSNTDPLIVERAIILLTDLQMEKRQLAARILTRKKDPRLAEAAVRAITDPDAEVRRWAAEALQINQSPEAVEPLLAALRDADAGVRNAAAATLPYYNDPRIADALLPLLTDAGMRAVVLRILRSSGDPRIITPLIADLRNPEPDTRVNAAFGLANWGMKASDGEWFFGLQDKQATEEAKAESALELIRSIAERVKAKPVNPLKITEPNDLAALLDALDDENEQVRFNLVKALGQIDNPPVTAALMKMLGDAGDIVRCQAAGILRAKGLVIDPEVLRDGLADEKPAARVAAVMSLNTRANPATAETAIKMLRDTSPAVFRACLYTLDGIRDQRIADAVTERFIRTPLAERRQLINIAGRAFNDSGPDARLLDPLMELLSTDRWAVMEHLLLFGKAGRARLHAALNSTVPDVRRHAIQVTADWQDRSAVDKLIDLLRDPDLSVRREAVNALGSLGDQRAADALVLLQQDADDNISRAAAISLARRGDDRRLALVLDTITGDDRTLCTSAVSSLGSLRDPRAVEPLLELLPKADKDLQTVIVRTLGEIGDARAAKPLIELLNGRIAQEATAEALGKLGDRQAVEPLCALLILPTPFTRDIAARALGKLGDPRAVVPLALAYLESRERPETDSLRAQNAELSSSHLVAAICRIGTSAVDILLDMLESPEVKQRGAAACVLAAIPEARAAPALIHLLADERASVRRSAAQALGAARDARALSPLLAALADPDAPVRAGAAEALGRLGDNRAGDALAAMLADPDEDCRTRAAFALAELGDARAAPYLTQLLLLRPEYAECITILRSLGKVKEACDTPQLITEYYAGPDPLMRPELSEIIRLLGDERAVEPLIELLTAQDTPAQIRRAAIDGLAVLKAKEAGGALLKALDGDDLSLRAAALSGLAVIGAPLGAIVPHLASTSLDVRRAAVFALGRCEDPRAMDLLLTAAKTMRDQASHMQAIYSLGDRKDILAVEPLLHMYRESDGMLREAIAAALGLLGDLRGGEAIVAEMREVDPRGWGGNTFRALGRLKEHRAAEAIAEMVKEEPGHSSAAIVALGEIDGPRAAEALLRVLACDDDGAREMLPYAIKALEQLKEPRAVPPLIALLPNLSTTKQTSLDPWQGSLRALAAHALGEIGDTRAVEPLLALLKQGSMFDRHTAAEALGKLGDRRAVPALTAVLDQLSPDARAAATAALEALENGE